MVFERRSKIKSRRNARSAFRRHLVRGIFGFVLVALVFWGIYKVTRVDAFTIHTIDVGGGATVPHETIEREVREELAGAYWKLVPRAFTLTYPHDEINAALLAHPRLHDVRVERDGAKLTVQFDEYVPYALLCSRDRACFFVDEQGFAFEEVPQLSGNALTRFTDETRERLARGDRFDIARLTAAESFIAAAEAELGMRIGSVTYTEQGDIVFSVNGGGELRVAGSRDLTESFENIKTVLAVPEYTHVEPGNFQYIDVRFPPKVFVNDEMTSATTTEATSTEPM